MRYRFESFCGCICFLFLVFLVGIILGGSPLGAAGEENPVLGPQSGIARGEQSVLIAAVRFPDAEPSLPLEQVKKRVTAGLDRYVREQSYGLSSVKADFRGWVRLPDPLSSYRVSPYNFKVDRSRVRKLIEDTMSALEGEVDFSRYQHLLIIPGVHTLPGKGYGMICYCANPGMLTGVRGNLGYATLRSKGGKQFSGGVFVGAENAHLGMFAHDFFHALGGLHDKKRLVGCQYDFERQSDTSQIPSQDRIAVFMGPWDIMSQHFLNRREPPPGLTSFTKIRLGWISAAQAVVVKPGETRHAFLSPLSKGGGTLVVKIPLKGDTYLLLENRQPLGYDRALPDSGLLITKVDPDIPEGYGTVRIVNADPKAPRFSHPTFRPDESNRNIFLDAKAGVAAIPLWEEGGALGVLVTTPEQSSAALNAAMAIRKLERSTKEKGSETRRKLEESRAAFKALNFKAAADLAGSGL